MMRHFAKFVPCGLCCSLLLLVLFFAPVQCPAADTLLAGVAVRDITPKDPVWLSGYASRDHPFERVDQPLLVQALALQGSGEKVVFVSLDNCEVTREFSAPVLEEIEKKLGLPREAVLIVSSHTHSAPVLTDTLPAMFSFEGEQADTVRAYSEFLRRRIVDVVAAALDDLEPATLEYGKGEAKFAMNRRIFAAQGVNFGENRDAPIDTDVPVLKVSRQDGSILAILFGYACHGTTISGDDFYAVSGEYMAYARELIEAAFPGAHALYLTGFGADINPSPRGELIYSKQHGLELAGAVTGVLNEPMRPVRGDLRCLHARIDLPFEAPPAREQIEKDAKSENRYMQSRARIFLNALDAGNPRPVSLDYPLSVVRIGDDLTFVLLAGEVVVDYSLRLKRELGGAHPWLVGYAMEVPCYIPSKRILLEGGYEADGSLIYYGIYGPFKPQIEDILVAKVKEMVAETTTK
jgi:neutral ceramidase